MFSLSPPSQSSSYVANQGTSTFDDMYQFLADFEKTLEQMQQSVQTFESSSEGYIKQEYLENDVEEGLDKVKRVAEGLSDEANIALDEVKDIVTLTKIDPGELVKSVQTGKQKTNNTLENLHELDRTLTAALEKVEKDLLVMKNYIEELSGKFKSGEVQVGEYNRFALETSETHNKMMEKIYPLESALEKLQSNFAYIAPYMAMQLPHKMFPLSYRGHSVSKTPINFDKIETSVEYQQLAEQNKLSVQEEEAISKYLKNLDEKDVSFNADDVKQPDYGPITFWDKRKVVGGNSSLAGTPDGLAGYATMAHHYFTDDIATVMNSEAAINERALSGFFLLPTPFKLLKPLDDVAGAKKAADVGKVGKGMGEIGWSMSVGGGIINERKYSQHALERMAPDIPEVKATLTNRAIKKAEDLGYKPQTKEFSDFIKKYVDPRDIPPSVIEDAIANTKKIPGNRSGTFIHGTQDIKVIINEVGDVITVIPK